MIISRSCGRSSVIVRFSRLITSKRTHGWPSLSKYSMLCALMDALLEHDEYCVMADFEAYSACQRRLADRYVDKPGWGRMSALNIARIGRFSSDRTIGEYARDTWNIAPIAVGLDPVSR